MTWSRFAAFSLGTALLVPTAAMARPEDGTGMFKYDSSDVLEHWDVPDSDIRVHYSVEGSNVTLLRDADEDGVPDFAATIGLEVAAALDLFEAAGFRRPVHESEVGLEPLGGSDALDVYLVDFGGSSDGQFGVDRCRSGVCAGYLLIENDFAGYGYSSLAEAARVLASHEFFHGVQYAYVDNLDPWFAEGTAVWAEHLYEPEVYDFIWFCTEYLSDTGRSLDRPPAGTVTSFSYGTALFFAFIHEQLGADLMVSMLEHLATAGDGDEVAAIVEAISDAGSDLVDLWPTFAAWNLATGRRAGGIESYSFASELRPGIFPEVSGSAIVDDNRFYPLAATYFELDHAGGELLLGLAEDNAEAVLFEVFSTDSDGVVDEQLYSWQPDAAEVVSLGEQDAGTYWLVGSYAVVGADSEGRAFCFGGTDAMADCELGDDPGDTGDPADDDPTPDTDDDTNDTDDGAGAEGDESDSKDKSGCSVASSSASTVWLLGALSLMGVVRRRRTR